ncbi:hypothetical protein [Agrococcus sp. TF02-05]|uniref:hypothetical protein n=1 Tax=Agrococcus sp. TF02-05 TaxID=2815211 RepID=UPI001AA0C3DF|nr:hypothetical protein [Agrococcus sp. TF02-05]MBO1770450.1 hypothetical protein [Agrococcus sp. TF02-05]
MRDVAEIKGMLAGTLAAHDERIRAVEADIDESRAVHTEHDKALAAHAARLAVVENITSQHATRLAQAGDQTRANAALIVSIVVGLASIGTAILTFANQIGATP